jgi:hypothetical protein
MTIVMAIKVCFRPNRNWNLTTAVGALAEGPLSTGQHPIADSPETAHLPNVRTRRSYQSEMRPNCRHSESTGQILKAAIHPTGFSCTGTATTGVDSGHWTFRIQTSASGPLGDCPLLDHGEFKADLPHTTQSQPYDIVNVVGKGRAGRSTSAKTTRIRASLPTRDRTLKSES